MRYSKFPRSGETVSRLGFGAMGFAGWFGEQTDRANVEALHRALAGGVNFIDTARAYGESERVVGIALRSWRGAKPFLATKIECLGPPRRWAMPLPVNTVFPKGQVRASCEASLRALGVEMVDLIQLHVCWPVWGLSGYWMDELQVLKQEGKARFVGVSLPDHRSDMGLGIVASGLIDSVQTIVNIFDPLALENLAPACAANGVGLIARCVLDEGGLTGFLSADTVFPPGDYREAYFDEIVPRAAYMRHVDRLRAFVPEHASSLAALALKFAIHDPAVTTALVSMHVAKFAEMNMAAVEESPLSDKVFDELFARHRFIKNLNYTGQSEW
jgi:methylglyoxal reductase